MNAKYAVLIVLCAITLGCTQKQDTGNENNNAQIQEQAQEEKSVTKTIEVPEVTTLENIGPHDTYTWGENNTLMVRKASVKKPEEMCGIDCEYSEYSYAVEEDKEVPTGKRFSAMGMQITEGEKQWVISPNKKWSVWVNAGTEKDPKEEIGKVLLRNEETQEEKTLLEGTYQTGYEQQFTANTYTVINWSPDSTMVLIRNNNSGADAGNLWKPEYGVVNITTGIYTAIGKSTFREMGRGEAVGYWSPDSKYVAIDDGKTIFEIATAKAVYVPESDELNNKILWSTRGTYAAFSLFDAMEGTYTTKIITKDGKELTTLSVDTIDVDWWDDETLVILELGALHVLNVRSGEEYRSNLPKIAATHMDISPTGEYVIFKSANVEGGVKGMQGEVLLGKVILH